LCGCISMKTYIPTLYAGFLALLLTGTSVAQNNSPPLPSLDQTLLDIRVPLRIPPPTAGSGSQNLVPPSVDPLINLRRMAEESNKSIESLRTAPAQETRPQAEPPRVCRRPYSLRDWGHEQEADTEVFA
jgi:hypothetical protein